MIETVADVNVKVSPEAHAWLEPIAADHRNVPDVDALQNDTSVNVSDVPPFVHGPTFPDRAAEPPDAEL